MKIDRQHYWSQATSGGEAVRPISTNFLYHYIEDQCTQKAEAEAGFEQTRTGHVISENQLPFPCPNIHDSRSKLCIMSVGRVISTSISRTQYM
jgi:hypothetical protein